MLWMACVIMATLAPAATSAAECGRKGFGFKGFPFFPVSFRARVLALHRT